MLKTILETMQNGEKVQLIGFGTFETVEKPGGTRRNPKTGETFEVTPYRTLQFKFSPAIKA